MRTARSASPFETGLELIRAGLYFHAPEKLETAWRAAEPDERDFLRGLVHVVVAWHQAGRGNRNGYARQLEKASRRLSSYAPAHRGADLDAALTRAREARDVVEGGSLDLPPPVV